MIKFISDRLHWHVVDSGRVNAVILKSDRSTRPLHAEPSPFPAFVAAGVVVDVGLLFSDPVAAPCVRDLLRES